MIFLSLLAQGVPMPSVAVAATLKAQSCFGSFIFVKRTVEAAIVARAALQPDPEVRTPVRATLQSDSAIVPDLSRHIPLAASVHGDSSFLAIRAPENYQTATELPGYSYFEATLRRHVPLASQVVGASTLRADIKVGVSVSAALNGHASVGAGTATHFGVFSNMRAGSTTSAEMAAHYAADALVGADSELGGRLLMFSISQGMLVEPEERSTLRNALSAGRRFKIKPSM